MPPPTAGVAPELTVTAAVVVPLACEATSTTDPSAAADTPEYSSAAIPISAADVAFTVIAGLVPPPEVTGALHTDSSVLSEALKCVSSV